MDNKTLGRNIRRLRQERGETLEQVASRCRLSVGFLSQVERGVSSPSVASLTAILDALETPISQFFQTPIANAAAITKAGEAPYQIRVGSSETVYSMLSGSRPNRTLEAFIAEYPPGYAPPVLPHEGEEFAFVLSGHVLLILDGEQHLLGPGDSFQIDSSCPHTIRNDGNKPAKILWVQTLKILR